MYLKRIKSLKKVKSFSAYELPRFEFPQLTDSFVGHYLSETSRPSSLYIVTKGASSSESFGHEDDEAGTSERVSTPSENLSCFCSSRLGHVVGDERCHKSAELDPSQEMGRHSDRVIVYIHIPCCLDHGGASFGNHRRRIQDHQLDRAGSGHVHLSACLRCGPILAGSPFRDVRASGDPTVGKHVLSRVQHFLWVCANKGADACIEVFEWSWSECATSGKPSISNGLSQ